MRRQRAARLIRSGHARPVSRVSTVRTRCTMRRHPEYEDTYPGSPARFFRCACGHICYSLRGFALTG